MTVTSARDVAGATDAAKRVVEVHRRLVEYLRAGRTAAEIDGFVAGLLRELDCKSCFRHYRVRGHPPFPSHSCISINDCIVHGTHTMSERPLEPGDLVSIDVGVKHRGWIGDAAWTYAIESASDENRRLMECGRESLRRGIDAIRPGEAMVAWARAVQPYVEQDCAFHLVRGLGGHGYGRKLHESPFISNVVPTTIQEWPEADLPFEPGMLIAVEPMLAVGTPRIRSVGREWPIFTADGSMSVHYEADVLVTEFGVENLTADLDELPDVVGD